VNANGGVAKFLEKRGEGLHHICLQTPDVGADLEAARAAGFPLIDQAPRKGLAGMICFLHPKGTCGVLTEFATPPSSHHAGPCGRDALRGLALREVTARTKEPDTAARLFHEKLGLVRADAPVRAGAAVAAVEVGGVRICFVGPDSTSATGETTALRAEIERDGEGIAGLVLEVRDPASAEATLAPLGGRREGGGLRLDPARCHGVPLQLVRTVV
jgi:catechol 2,3-dioxygenase-like lactoylglutathione lyase family enzyme